VKPLSLAAATLAVLALSGAIAAGAGRKASPRRGLAIVDQWCRMCHSIEGEETDPDRAPTFATIVKRKGRTRAYFRHFLREDHFPMTTFRLFEQEKADVVAFLLWLQKE
jgi:mono/diheme cytochrome c family protein